MNTPLENAREKYIDKHWGECTTCKHYCCRRAKRDGKVYMLEWCENEDSENYKQLLEEITDCDQWTLN